jgi:hypothetical protein
MRDEAVGVAGVGVWVKGLLADVDTRVGVGESGPANSEKGVLAGRVVVGVVAGGSSSSGPSGGYKHCGRECKPVTINNI